MRENNQTHLEHRSLCAHNDKRFTKKHFKENNPKDAKQTQP